MIRRSHSLFAGSPAHKGTCDILTRMALGYDIHRPPEYVNTYREAIALQEKGQISVAKEKLLDALESSECKDKYHKAAICSHIKEIERVEKNQFLFLKVYSVLATVGFIAMSIPKLQGNNSPESLC